MKTETIILDGKPDACIQQWLDAHKEATILFILGSVEIGQLTFIYTEV